MMKVNYVLEQSNVWLKSDELFPSCAQTNVYISDIDSLYNTSIYMKQLLIR